MSNQYEFICHSFLQAWLIINSSVIHEDVKKKYSHGNFILIQYYWSFQVKHCVCTPEQRAYWFIRGEAYYFLYIFSVFDKIMGKN